MDTVDPRKIARQLRYKDNPTQIQILVALVDKKPFHRWNGYIKRSYESLKRQGLIRHSFPMRSPYIKQWTLTPLGRDVAQRVKDT